MRQEYDCERLLSLENGSTLRLLYTLLNFQIKLLTRFLEAAHGQILLDGIPLGNYDKKMWREV